MAKVTVIFEDKADEESGDPTVGLSIEFEPEITRGQQLSRAQQIGMQLAQNLAGSAGVGDEVVDAMSLDTKPADVASLDGYSPAQQAKGLDKLAVDLGLPVAPVVGS